MDQLIITLPYHWSFLPITIMILGCTIGIQIFLKDPSRGVDVYVSTSKVTILFSLIIGIIMIIGHYL